jgi:hypothetical protein
MQDDGMQMVFSEINIVFAKCNSSKLENDCKSKEEIDEFLQDLNINSICHLNLYNG